MIPAFEDILQARERIQDKVGGTSFSYAKTLSSILGVQLFIKFESENFTASFKERGALNKLLCLTESERRAGVVAMSAGNHAKAVAYHASRLGISAKIVMPRNTPYVKAEDTRHLGAEVVLHGANLDESAAKATEISNEEGRCFIHPYDDKEVIAGQGTVALEILEQDSKLDALVIPIGGGGLISGVAVAARQLAPEVEIVGVQSQSYPAVHGALKGEETVSKGITIAEGIAVKRPGKTTLEIIRKTVDDVLLVSESDIDRAIFKYVNIEKVVAEGAGAASLAAIMAYPDRFKGKRVGIVLSGANIDARILATVLFRNLARSGHIIQLQLTIDDTPGSLSEVSNMIGCFGANILEVGHQRTFADIGIRETVLNFTLEVRDPTHVAQLKEKLNDAGYRAVDL